MSQMDEVSEKRIFELKEHKIDTLNRIRDESGCLFDIGFNLGRLETLKEEKQKGEVTFWKEASEQSKLAYKSGYCCTDELFYWCGKCLQPLSGHWAKTQWWEFCPWCGRRFVKEESEADRREIENGQK